MSDPQDADRQLHNVEAVDHTDDPDSQATEALPLAAEWLTCKGILAKRLDGGEDGGLQVSRESAQLLDGPSFPFNRDRAHA